MAARTSGNSSDPPFTVNVPVPLIKGRTPIDWYMSGPIRNAPEGGSEAAKVGLEYNARNPSKLPLLKKSRRVNFLVCCLNARIAERDIFPPLSFLILHFFFVDSHLLKCGCVRLA